MTGVWVGGLNPPGAHGTLLPLVTAWCRHHNVAEQAAAVLVSVQWNFITVIRSLTFIRSF